MATRALPGAPEAHQPGGPFSPGRPLAALRHSDFRILLAGNTALQIGSWVQTIGMGWLLLHDLGASATVLGLVALLRGATQLCLGPLGGYLGDRFTRLTGVMLGLSLFFTASALLVLGLAPSMGRPRSRHDPVIVGNDDRDFGAGLVRRVAGLRNGAHELVRRKTNATRQ